MRVEKFRVCEARGEFIFTRIKVSSFGMKALFNLNDLWTAKGEVQVVDRLKREESECEKTQIHKKH